MDLGTASKLLVIMLTPTAIAGAAVWLPRVARAVQQRWRSRNDALQPAGPPLEQSAAALRRLMAEHAHVLHSPDIAVRSSHLRALEGALADCALDAARAVGLPPPPRSGRAALSRAELRELLTGLEGSGLVLPSPEHFGR